MLLYTIYWVNVSYCLFLYRRLLWRLEIRRQQQRKRRQKVTEKTPQRIRKEPNQKVRINVLPLKPDNQGYRETKTEVFF